MRRWALLLCLCVALVGGCASVPRDPEGTLERIRSEHVVRVGVLHSPPWTDISGGEPKGREIEMIRAFAQAHGAQPQWTIAGDEELIRLLEEGEVDLVVGGFTHDTPWQKKAAVTRPWTSDVGPDGKKREHVVLAPLGENALVTALERFADGYHR